MTTNNKLKLLDYLAREVKYSGVNPQRWSAKERVEICLLLKQYLLTRGE
jgi:hypothetical protein